MTGTGRDETRHDRRDEAPHGDPRHGEAPEYRAARLRRALAEDTRTAELGIQVHVRGEHVYLSGSVSSAECKHHLDTVLHDQEPALHVHNDVRVVEAGEPGEPEVLR